MSDRKRTAKGFVVLLINLVTAFSVAVTAISPRQIANLTSSLASQAIIENQPLLQLYSSISMIPINMVSKMLGEKFTGVKSAAKNNAREKNEKNCSSSDFSFALPDCSSSLLKTQNLQSISFLTLPDGLLAMPPGYQQKLFMTGCGQCIIFLSILLFLITLRRRSLPAPYFNNIIYRINPILVVKRIGFFNLCLGLILYMITQILTTITQIRNLTSRKITIPFRGFHLINGKEVVVRFFNLCNLSCQSV